MGLYHWDIKPVNIFVKSVMTNHGDIKYIFKLGDYGMVTNNRIVHNKISKLVDKGVISSIDELPNPTDSSKSDIFSTFDEKLFSGTWIYIPDQEFRITCHYRDMYAFVLSIFVIIHDCKNNNNPNKIYSDEIYRLDKNNKGPLFGSERNLSLEDMLSDIPSSSNLLL